MSEENDGEDPALLGTGTWTRQGPATLVLRENAWVVLVPGLRKQVIEATWTVLGEKPAPEDFLDRLVEVAELGSVDKLTAILFGFHDGTSGVFGVKGKTPIAVYTAEGSQQIAGTDDEPFVLRTLEGVRRTAFGDLPPEDGLGAPRLEAGVVPVRGFVHVTIDPAELEESERAALTEQVGKDGRSIEDPEAAKRRAERPAPKPAGAPAVTRPATSTRADGGASSTSTGGAGSSGAPRSSAPPEPDSSTPNMFDGLFGGSPAPGSAALSAASTTAGAATPPTPVPSSERPPAPSAAPSPESASAAPPAASTGAPTTTDAPAAGATSEAEAPRPPVARKPRLVSSSLFDRRSRGTSKDTASTARPTAANSAPAPRSTTEADASSDAEPAASAGSSTPGPPAARSAEHTPAGSPAPPAAPAPESAATLAEPVAPAAAAAASAPRPTAPVSIPTPEPPEDEEELQPLPAAEEDDFVSPVTQVAPIEEEDVQEARPAPAPRRAPAPRAVTSTAAGNDLENTGAYDDLFGKTVFRRIEDAAVRQAEDGDDEVEEGTTTGTGVATGSPTAAGSPSGTASHADGEPAPAPEPEQSSAPNEFIDWVPGVGRAAPEIAQTAARRASAPSAPEPAYPQVHMAERPPAPNTGSRPAPARTPAPYEQSGASPHPGRPMNTGVAGQQLGYQSWSGHPPHPPQGPVNSGAASHQVGSPGQRPASGPGGAPGQQRPGGAGGQSAPAPSWSGSPNPPRPPHYDAAPSQQQFPAQQNVPPQQPMSPRQGVRPQQGMPPQQGVRPQQGMPSHQGGPPQRQSTAPHQGAAPQPSQASASSAGGAGPAVGSAVALPGLVCNNGHANSPERAVCRSCGAPLQGATRTVARPPLGVVLISGGESFVLDRTAIIGRRPRASRVSGNDVPQLITVPSPQQDISRSHLELRLEGWHVVALDLGATNGTTLYREGFEPVRLRPREGVVLHDGDHLDLGDDVHLKFGERV